MDARKPLSGASGAEPPVAEEASSRRRYVRPSLARLGHIANITRKSGLNVDSPSSQPNPTKQI